MNRLVIFSFLVLLNVSVFAEYYPTADGWNCKYIFGTAAVFLPESSNACGTHAAPTRSLCVGSVECEKGDLISSRMVACDALSNGTCPNPALCIADKSIRFTGKAKIAVDTDVKTFWQTRALNQERLKKEQTTFPHVSQTHE